MRYCLDSWAESSPTPAPPLTRPQRWASAAPRAAAPPRSALAGLQGVPEAACGSAAFLGCCYGTQFEFLELGHIVNNRGFGLWPLILRFLTAKLVDRAGNGQEWDANSQTMRDFDPKTSVLQRITDRYGSGTSCKGRVHLRLSQPFRVSIATRLNTALKPCIIWSLGPKALRYESSEP